MLSPSRLGGLLDALEKFYGTQEPSWPTDPYLFLVWWHCGYPASDAACAKGWESLTREIGVDPERLLAANPVKLAAGIKPGGMVPELRAMRLKEIAERIKKDLAGIYWEGLKGLPLARVRAALKKFPGISRPGGGPDFTVRRHFSGGGGAVELSSCFGAHRLGRERENYGVDVTREALEHDCAGSTGEVRCLGTRVFVAEGSRAEILQAEESEMRRVSSVSESCAFFQRGKDARACDQSTGE